MVLAGGGGSAGIGPVRPPAGGGGWRRRSEKDRIRQHRHHQCAPDRAQGTGGGNAAARRRQGRGDRAARPPFFRERNCARGDRRVPGPSLSGLRSEEHTSELQSLMRISYAVFCLKKKTNNQRT